MDTAGQGRSGADPETSTRREWRARDAEQNAGVAEQAATTAGAGTSAVEPGVGPGGAEQSPVASEHDDVEKTATSDHDVIRQWADDRHATPATVESAEHDGSVELRIDFDFGNHLEDLKQVTWDEWFAAFDERGYEFVFQEAARADGSVSNEFHLEPAHGTAR